MVSYTFKWPYPAEEVYVTGDFDEWKKTQKLEKVGDGFEKAVQLPDDATALKYKFVVDGEWKTDDKSPKEEGGEGNNILTVADLLSASAGSAFISSVGPEATTAKMAEDAALPGAFPETPANDLDKEKEFKVSPLPAAEGAINPIQLAPGEKIPESITSQDINSNVKLDKESYEKADTLPGVSTELPPVSKNMIPESSLPIAEGGDVTINTVGPTATTAGLAAKVPLEEPAVPAAVKESQEKAGWDPEASGVSEEVKEKGEVEQELLKKVPTIPATSEGTAGKGTEKSETDKTLLETATATAAGVGAAALATAVVAKDTVVDKAGAASANLPDSVKQNLPAAVQGSADTTAKEVAREEVSPEVPAPVKESIQEAGKSPEAAGNTAAVEEKKAVEAELLKEVKPVEKTEESAAKPESKPEAAATNGGESSAKAAETPATPAKPAATTPSTTPRSTDGPATAEKKKKHRLSAFLSKLKPKKDKA